MNSQKSEARSQKPRIAESRAHHHAHQHIGPHSSRFARLHVCISLNKIAPGLVTKLQHRHTYKTHDGAYYRNLGNGVARIA